MASDQSPELEPAKSLADAATRHAQIANRIWLANLLTAVVLLIPSKTISAEHAGPCYDLPFAFARCIDGHLFYSSGFVLLAVLTIAFAAAHAQQLLVHDRIQRVFGEGDCGEPLGARELFDLMRESSIHRVAPLVQVVPYIRRWVKSQRPQVGQNPWAICLYAFVKIPVALVVFIFPGFVLISSYMALRANASRHIVPLTVLGVVALVALVEVTVADVAYSIKTNRFVG